MLTGWLGGKVVNVFLGANGGTRTNQLIAEDIIMFFNEQAYPHGTKLCTSLLR